MLSVTQIKVTGQTLKTKIQAFVYQPALWVAAKVQLPRWQVANLRVQQPSSHLETPTIVSVPWKPYTRQVARVTKCSEDGGSGSRGEGPGITSGFTGKPTILLILFHALFPHRMKVILPTSLMVFWRLNTGACISLWHREDRICDHYHGPNTDTNAMPSGAECPSPTPIAIDLSSPWQLFSNNNLNSYTQAQNWPKIRKKTQSHKDK